MPNKANKVSSLHGISHIRETLPLRPTRNTHTNMLFKYIKQLPRQLRSQKKKERSSFSRRGQKAEKASRKHKLSWVELSVAGDRNGVWGHKGRQAWRDQNPGQKGRAHREEWLWQETLPCQLLGVLPPHQTLAWGSGSPCALTPGSPGCKCQVLGSAPRRDRENQSSKSATVIRGWNWEVRCWLQPQN